MGMFRRWLALAGKVRRENTQLHKVNVIYLCDRKKCEKCSFPLCKHTTDIKHAIRFKQSEFDESVYIEE
jgi:hypothetical protein